MYPYLTHLPFQYPIFKIRRYFSWLVVVHQPEYLKDITRARDDQISFLDALNEVKYLFVGWFVKINNPKGAQFDYTIGPELHANLSHINITRGSMARNIAARFLDLLDEADKSIHEITQGANEGTPYRPVVIY